ncbi:mediator of RNA polymerase II transcription subunit 15a-like [Raphanus sativus]|uniref:Mediator of RNA polymerase II transcription subunit 15a-like n=1 Tax=Raphanus sativus TaxID=3726 RepID=A0A9W3CD83_RAPSA|nr:mediator of RNA polymerase II transcription subunit 15a-like [Raphanus sativus]
MEGHSSRKPNEQGGDSLASDWRSQHEPDLRKRVALAIVEKLKIFFPRHNTDSIKKTACTFEHKIYGMAKDKNDYLRKIHEMIIATEKKFRTGGTSANGANTPDQAAQALNQGQSLPTSSAYAQTPTSQRCLSESNIPESSGLPTQPPMTVSAASQNLNIQMGEGVESNLGPGPQRQIQGRQQLLQKPQKQQQSSNTMYQHQMDQQLLKGKIHHGNHQPQQHHQQMPHHRSLSPIERSFPQSSALSSHPQKMAVPSQQHKILERKHHISQLMNGQDTQQTHLTSQQSNGEKQRTSQQNSMASFNVHGSSLFGTQGQEVKRSQSMMLQHSNNTQRFQTAGSMHQSQNLAAQQKQPYQFQTAQPANPSISQDSKGKMLNISGGDWREETYQKIKALKEEHSILLNTMLQRLSENLQAIDSIPEQKMAYEPHAKNLRAGKAALEQVLAFLNVSRGSVSERLRDKFSVYERQILKFVKSQREWQQQQVHLHPSQTHQTSLQSQSGQVHVPQSLDSVQMNSSLMPNHQNGPLSCSVSSLKTSRGSYSSQTRPMREPKDDNNIMSSSSGNAVVQHSLEQSPQLVTHSNQERRQQQQLQQHLSSSQRHLPKPSASPARVSDMSPSASSPQVQNYHSPHQLVEQQTLPTPFNKTESQEHPPLVTPTPEPITERPIDRLIKAIQSSSRESLAQSASEMSSVISMSDRFAGSIHSTRGFRASVAEDLSERTRLRLQQGNTKRFKRSFTTMPLDITTSQSDSYKQFSVDKIEPSHALLQEITEINGRLLETVVSICNDDVRPREVNLGLTVVTCAYVPVALSPTFKALYDSGHISQIQPLRLLAPQNYPNSPILLDNVLFDSASEDLSSRARSRFSLAMTKYSEPVLLKEIAKVWDECARAAMLEYAERRGGGTFSSKYGRWESVLRAS